MKEVRFFIFILIILVATGCRTTATNLESSPASGNIEDLPLLPAFQEGNTNGIGEPLLGGTADPFAQADFRLEAEFPEGLETAVVEEIHYLSIEEAHARTLANQFGFAGPLFMKQVEPETTSPTGEENSIIYTAIDGERRISFMNTGLIIEDRQVTVDFSERPTLSVISPLIETQLKAWGLLDFPYELRELPSGDLAIFRLIDGLAIEQNEYNILFNHDGDIAFFDYRPLREISVLGTYPLQSAGAAWQQLQDPSGRRQMRYQIWPRPPAADSEAAAAINPRIWQPITDSGLELHLYITPAVYVAIDGRGYLIGHGDFILTGEEEILSGIATHSDDVLHIWGISGQSNGTKTLDVTGWEVIDMVNYETLDGTVTYEDGQAYFHTVLGETFILAAAPQDIPADIEVFVHVAGRRDTDADFLVLDWVRINENINWSEMPVNDEHLEEEPPASAIKTVTIDTVNLIYLPQYPNSGLPYENNNVLLVPLWKFTGETDQNQFVTFWLPAIVPDLIETHSGLLVGTDANNPLVPDKSEPTRENLCLDIPRPAAVFSVTAGRYLITNPMARASCYTTLDGELSGRFQAVHDAVFYTILQNDELIIKRLANDGTATLLSFTAVNLDDVLLNHSFVVSPDGGHIAWSAASAGADYAGPEVSNMWVSSIDGDEIVAPLPELQSTGENRQALVPVRFSADNSTLFYTLQPIGLGGAWSSFVGRYDNLYALRLHADSPPELIFECTGEQPILCIGDFFEVGGQVSALSYVDGKTVMVINGSGDNLNTIQLSDDYVGYPTFSPGGELLFYGAMLSTDPQASIMPVAGTIYRVAPPTAAHEVLKSGYGILYPFDWLDDTHVVIAYSAGGENWGAAIVGLDGSLEILQAEPVATFMDVLPVQNVTNTR
jgi:hypothetical protein